MWSLGTQLRTASLSGALFCITLAQAYGADAKSDPCLQFGRGYFTLPGTSTCVAVSGDLKTDYRHRFTGEEILVEPQRDATGAHVAAGLSPPSRPLGRHLTELKGFIRTASTTEYGILTTAFGLKYQMESPPRRPDDLNNEFNRTGERLLLERASIQLGGASVGVMPSFFDFTPSLNYTTLYASEQSLPLVAYTKHIGPTAVTLALEDSSQRRIIDSTWGEYRNQFSPDLVGSVRRRFDWGNIHLAAAAHPINASQPLDCCAPLSGSAVGWAAMFGIEGWFDFADMSGEFLLNVGASKGALSYLAVTDYPADFVLSSGGLFLTSAQAVVASYANWWTKEWRTVITVSGFRTNLETDTFHLRTQGLRWQGALEFYPRFIPRRGLLVGVELNYHDERVSTADQFTPSAMTSNNYVSAMVYTRRRF